MSTPAGGLLAAHDGHGTAGGPGGTHILGMECVFLAGRLAMTGRMPAPMPQMVRICDSGADYTTRARAESCASSQEFIVEVTRFIPQARTVADVTIASASGTNC